MLFKFLIIGGKKDGNDYMEKPFKRDSKSLFKLIDKVNAFKL